MKILLSLVMLVWGSAVIADQETEATPEPLVPAPTVDSELLESQVTIVERENDVMYEYRVNGQIYMVKIQPTSGPAYYLLDMDGDGDFDVQGDDPAKIVVPHWVFFRW